MSSRCTCVAMLAIALLALPFDAVAFAQRGGRGGGGGGKSGDGGNFIGRGDGGSDRGGGGGKSFSNQGSRSIQSSSSRDGQRSYSTNKSSKSSRSNDNRSDGSQHESFYRGSDGSDRGRGDRDGDRSFNTIGKDRNKDRDWDRNNDWADGIRRNWGGYERDRLPFRYGWWDSYGFANYPVYSPWRYSRWRDRPYYWWGWSSPSVLTDWLVFGWDRPAYWAYGPGRNIYYQNDYVYYDGRQTMAAESYYKRLYDLAHSVPNIDQAEAEKMDWKPLGVFAVSRESDPQSDRSLQLAVNRDGVISGTYFNRQKNEVHPLVGMVDERTQRAAWAFADGTDDAIIFETSIYNLTNPTSTLMVHFGPKASDAEVWQLVRLEQPEDLPAPSTAPRRDLP